MNVFHCMLKKILYGALRYPRSKCLLISVLDQTRGPETKTNEGRIKKSNPSLDVLRYFFN